MKNDQIFFVGQKAFIGKDNKVLVLFNTRNKIDFPGGKIQEGEEQIREAQQTPLRVYPRSIRESKAKAEALTGTGPQLGNGRVKASILAKFQRGA